MTDFQFLSWIKLLSVIYQSRSWDFLELRLLISISYIHIRSYCLLILADIYWVYLVVIQFREYFETLICIPKHSNWVTQTNHEKRKYWLETVMHCMYKRIDYCLKYMAWFDVLHKIVLRDKTIWLKKEYTHICYFKYCTLKNV